MHSEYEALFGRTVPTVVRACQTTWSLDPVRTVEAGGGRTDIEVAESGPSSARPSPPGLLGMTASW
jgi:hypothetical protein